MTNSKATKRALLTSSISLLICFAMLLGTTFAWFTDTVTNGVNKIVSGNLDVELWHSTYTQSFADLGVGYGYSEANGEEVKADTKLFLNKDSEAILWEPGAEAVENFRIKNEGSLALKYMFKLEVANATKNPEGKDLTDIIMLSMDEIGLDNQGNPTKTSIVSGKKLGDGYVIEGEILPEKYYDFSVGLEWVPSDRDNEFNLEGGLELDLGITLLATQLTYEKDDVNGDQYDAPAEYPVISTAKVPAGNTEVIRLSAKEVTVEIPAGADEGVYRLEVSNKSVTKSGDETTVGYDISLYKGSEKVSGVPILVEINIGKLLQITEVTHNGNAMSDYEYNQQTGVVSFVTESFSPFAVTYKEVDSTPVNNISDLIDACYKGGYYKLTSDLILDDTTVKYYYSVYITAIMKDTVLDLNGHDIVVDVSNSTPAKAPVLFYIYKEGASLTVVGDGNVIAKKDAFIFFPRGVSDGAYIYGGNYYNNDDSSGTKGDINAIGYSQTGKINVYGGTFTFKNVNGHCGGFNVYDNSGAEIVLHEGVLLSNSNYYKGSDGDEIHLAEGCTLKEVVIDGATWYKVVKA